MGGERSHHCTNPAPHGTVCYKDHFLFVSIAPSQSPINVRALNKTHPTKIVVRWNPIPDSFYVHGILRGYKVFYKATAIANEDLEEGLETNQVTVPSSNLSAVLENLNAFTRYRIEVLAFTVKGDGVKSTTIKAGNFLTLVNLLIM